MSVSEVKHLVIEFFRTGSTSDVIMAGDTVRNKAGHIGIVKFIDISPYWCEEKQGVERAYVVYADCTDYCLEGEIELVG